MQSHSAGHIDGAPSKEPAPPGEIRVLSVGEEIFGEELTVDRGIVERLTAIERGCAARPENIIRFIELTKVRFACAAIEMALFAEHHNAGGIDGHAVHAKQLSAGGGCVGPRVERS